MSSPYSLLLFGSVCILRGSLVSHASPSYEKIEKGSGQKGCTNASQRNAIIAIKMCVKENLTTTSR